MSETVISGGPDGTKLNAPPPAAPAEPKVEAKGTEISLPQNPPAPAPIAPVAAPIQPPVYIPQPVMAPSLREEKFEDLIYSDAEKAKQLLKNEILGEIQQREETKTRQKSFWETFYSENSDLKSHQRVVDLIMKDKLSEFKDLPLEEGKKKLALEVRNLLSSIRSNTGVSEKELPSGVVPTLPASGAPVSSGSRPVVQGPKNFVDQLSNLKSKKGHLN